MLALEASSEVLIGSAMQRHSHIANVRASRNVRNLLDECGSVFSHHANMDDEDDKNGGPNHLKAWMRYRKVKGAHLAKALEITPGMVSDLVNSNRALSAKWLRRIAPVLDVTPGLLLDHDPYELDNDVIDIWVNASASERRQISDVAKALTRTGTDG